jgi:hypothetical protein
MEAGRIRGVSEGGIMITAVRRIIAEASSWPGVVTVRGADGQTLLRIGRCEIGHLHDYGVAHFAFPVGLWLGLIDEGHVEPHPLERAGLAERRIHTEADVADVIALLRLNYDRIVMRAAAPAFAAAGVA